MSDKQDRQIVDIHSHIFWYPDHLSLELVSEALAAKKVKIERESGRKNIWFNEQEVSEIFEAIKRVESSVK